MYTISKPQTKYVLYRIKIRIEDYTNTIDPNIRVTNPIMVKGYKDKLKLIERINEFKTMYNLHHWNRSEETLLYQLYIHNIIYSILYPIKFIPKIHNIVNNMEYINLYNSDERKYTFDSIGDCILNIKNILDNLINR